MRRPQIGPNQITPITADRELREVRRLQSAGSEAERKIITILKVLSESSEPLGSITMDYYSSYHLALRTTLLLSA